MRINGRRGAFLLAFATMHVILGASYAFPETSASVERSVGFLVALGIPVSVAGIPWIVSGVAAAAAALVKAPPGRDGWGFQSLIFIECAWAGVFLCSWLAGSHSRGWTWATVFAAMAAAVYLVSGMVDPATLLPRQERRG